MPSIKESKPKGMKVAAQIPYDDRTLPSDKALFEIIAQSSFFKKKHQEAEEALLKVNWSQISEKAAR